VKDDLFIKNGIIIPGYEVEITASRAGGPGGQHVNKADTRITVRWNIKKTIALAEKQKAWILENLQARLTSDGDLIIHDGSSRSQQQNKKNALMRLVQVVRKALYIPKKRKPTRTPKAVKESRLRAKKRRGEIKKMRSKKMQDD